MTEIEVLLRDGSSFKVPGPKLTTHEHMGVQPCNESLRKVLKNRDGYLAVVADSGYPDSNIERRILSEEILDIRKNGTTVFKQPPRVPDEYWM